MKFTTQLINADYNNNKVPITSDLLASYKILKQDKSKLVLEKDGVKYTCQLLSYEDSSNQVVLKVNGAKLMVSLKKEVDLILEKFGISNSSSQLVNELKAPMPGVVLEVNVAAGDKVKVGDPLLILEAMKMENVLSSPVDGIISSIEVNKKDTVEKNTILLKFE